jgi:hypothetical protein
VTQVARGLMNPVAPSMTKPLEKAVKKVPGHPPPLPGLP